MDEALYIVNIVIGNVLLTKTLLGREAVNTFVNTTKADVGGVELVVSIRAYEFIGEKTTKV